jgi:DNA-binding transcriptional MocR family regulator
LRDVVPEWRIVVPAGGMALWCELPAPAAGQLVREAARRGLTLTPGAVSSVTAAQDTTLRIPFVHTGDQLVDVAERIGAAWRSVVEDVGVSRDR